MKSTTLSGYGVKVGPRNKKQSVEVAPKKRQHRRRKAVYCMEGRHWVYFLVGGRMCKKCFEKRSRIGL